MLNLPLPQNYASIIAIKAYIILKNQSDSNFNYNHLYVGMFSAVQIQLNQLCMRSTFEFELLFSAAALLRTCMPILHHIKVVQLNSWWKVLF